VPIAAVYHDDPTFTKVAEFASDCPYPAYWNIHVVGYRLWGRIELFQATFEELDRSMNPIAVF